MTQKWICLFLLLFVARASHAFESSDSLLAAVPPGFGGIIVSSDCTSVTIPFTRAGNLILIKAKIDSTEGNFVLDTGAPGLVLNITYFRQYAVSAAGGDQGGITGGVSDVYQAVVPHLSFHGIHYHQLETDVINLGQIESKKGVRILGLLGMQLFERFEMIIDYQHSLLHLHLIGRKEAAKYRSEQLSDTSTYSVIQIDLIKNKIIAHASIANKKLLFVVDYGAETNVLDSRLPGRVLDHFTVSQRVLLHGAGDNKVEALFGTMQDVTIGTQRVASLPMLVTNLEKMCYSYNYCIDGMLGFDYLSLHKVGFNFVKRKMYIWK